MPDFSRFSRAQWARMKPPLATDVRDKAGVDDRRVLSGIVHTPRGGGRCADWADVYGPKKTLFNSFARWSHGEDGRTSSAVWPALKNPRPGILRRYPHQGPPLRWRWKRGASLMASASREGQNTKLHAGRNEKGRPVVLLPTPGNINDRYVAQPCIEAMPSPPNWSLTRDTTARACANDWRPAELSPSSRPRKNRKTQYDDDTAI
jgi:transposase